MTCGSISTRTHIQDTGSHRNFILEFSKNIVEFRNGFDMNYSHLVAMSSGDRDQESERSVSDDKWARDAY